MDLSPGTRRKPPEPLVRGTMRNDEVLDAVVDLAGDDAAIDEIVFGVIGAKTDDACRPDTRHSRYLEELIEGRGVDIGSILRRGDGGGASRRPWGLQCECSGRR